MSSLKPHSHQTNPYAFSSQILVSLLRPGIVFERSSAHWLAASLYSMSIYKVFQGRCNVVSECVSLFASLATSSFLVRWTRWCCLFSWKEMDTLLFRRAWSVFLSDDDKVNLMPMTRAWVSPSRLKAILCVNSALVMTSCLPAHRVSKRVPFEFSFLIL